MGHKMSQDKRRSHLAAEGEGRRRGVVLGLTIAEIILLILFALLLAMTGILIKRQIAVKAQYEAQSASRPMSQVLSPVIAGKLQSMNIDITQPEGEARLLAVLDAAQSTIENKPAKEQSRMEMACQAGLELQNALGKNLNATELMRAAKLLREDLEMLKTSATSCKEAVIPPPCYEKSKGEPSVYLYDLQITSTGILFVSSLPEKYRTRFETEFKNPPPQNKVLSNADFQALTAPFLNYGKKNQCKFYVKVYDETDGNKEKLRKSLKLIESPFVWTFMMSGKAEGSEKSLNVFPTESLKAR